MLKINRFSYAPISSQFSSEWLSASGLDVWLSESFRPGVVGHIYFHDPGIKWESMEQDCIIRTHPMEWALARLLFILHRSDPRIELADFLRVQGNLIRLPFTVRELSNNNDRIVARLALTATKEDVRWEGPARSYPLGKAAGNELENLMLAEPECLTAYELAVPWRKAMGWNGKRFLGQRIVHRPSYYSPENIASRRAGRAMPYISPATKPHFRVTEYPRNDAAATSSPSNNRGRYTGSWPPPEAWADTPNWKYALDEEGRAGQDETTLKPASEQAYISDESDYTAAEGWLADGRFVHALMGLLAGQPHQIICFEDTAYWEFTCGAHEKSALTREQQDRFPVRIISRLSRDPRDPARRIRAIIQDSGQVTDWD